MLTNRELLQSHFDDYECANIEERMGEMPTSQQTPGCGDRASSRENGIVIRQPCRVDCHLVTVSQGKGNVTEGSRLRKIYAPLTKCTSMNILIYDDSTTSSELPSM
eukprot:1518082-Pleurochrysis_carterae.AAC.1